MSGEVKDIYLFVESAKTSWMGNYDASCEDVTITWADTLEGLIPRIAVVLASKTLDYPYLFKVKALMYNGKPHISLFENFPYSDFMDYASECFIECKQLEHTVWYDLKEKAKQSEDYCSHAKWLKNKEKQEKQERQKEEEEKERNLYIQLKAKYEGDNNEAKRDN